MNWTPLRLARETVVDWWKGDSLPLGAALAYYSLFSLAPTLIIVIAIAGLVFGEEAARGQLVGQFDHLIGRDGAAMIEDVIARAAIRPGSGLGASVLALGSIFFGASGAFAQLQRALDEIWEVEPEGSGFWLILRDRVLSFGMVVLIGFLLLVSLVVAAGIAALDEIVGRYAGALQPMMTLVHFAVSVSIETALFAGMLKFLPHVSLRWSEVWVGGLVTALLFEAGKWLIGLYLGTAGIGSAYGAAGSLVVLLLWVYYTAQIVFIGGHFTKVLSRRRGTHPGPRPARGAGR
jgi:membrane protein